MALKLFKAEATILAYFVAEESNQHLHIDAKNALASEIDGNGMQSAIAFNFSQVKSANEVAPEDMHTLPWGQPDGIEKEVRDYLK